MDSLTFRCPQTGRVIDTGIRTDQRTMATIQSVKLGISCPHCAGTHPFVIEEGRLADAGYARANFHATSGYAQPPF